MFIPLKDDNPTARFPAATVALIAINVAVFVIQALSPRGLEYYVLRMGAIPYEISHFHSLADFPVARVSPLLSLFTHMFLHGGPFHLAGNMLYLWIFGNNVEDALGRLRFVLFYLLCGLSASFTHIAFNPGSTLPMIGASGAIAGVLGGYALMFPRARVRTLVFLFIFIEVVPVPAAVILGLWFVMQVMNIGLGGGVAWFAHVGGFLVGMGLIRAFHKKRPQTVDFRARF
jgi:membrane associated rhomboid family serine protease